MQDREEVYRRADEAREWLRRHLADAPDRDQAWHDLVAKIWIAGQGPPDVPNTLGQDDCYPVSHE